MKNAVIEQKFFFRTNIFDSGPPVIKELTLDQIFFSTDESSVGLFCTVAKNFWKEFVSRTGKKLLCCDLHYKKMLSFLKNRVTGQKKTLATWMRDYVSNHPDYKQDSVVTNTISYDLCKKIIDISYGVDKDPNF